MSEQPPTTNLSGTTEPPPEEATAALRELAERLLTVLYPGLPEAGAVQLLPNRLPETWPEALPLPMGSRVVGSLVRPQQVTAVFDTPGTLEQVRAFYQERLLAAGWTAPEPMGPQGGFAASMFEQHMGLVFCQGPRGPALRVQVFPLPGSGVDLRLTLDHDPRHSPCNMPRGARRMEGMGMRDILPALHPPPGARQFPEGGGGQPDRLHADARLEAGQDLGTLATHYEAQLAQAGWEWQEAGRQDPVAWSTWTFQDEGEPWRGLFVMLRRPDVPGEYFLSVRAEWTLSEAEAGPGGGWSMTFPR